MMAQQGKYEIERLKFLSATEVREIANTFGTPTYVYDKERINDQIFS
jgi:diaminopimelate decarboxylase